MTAIKVLFKSFVTLLYTGYFPAGSGTLASILTIIPLSIWKPGLGISLIIISLITVLSIFIENYLEKKKLIPHDPPFTVIDEVIGMWITALPLTLGDYSFTYYVAAFGLFRFFDIVKPLGIRFIDERVGGGFGVMLDDIIAGLWGMGLLYLIIVIL